MATEINAGRVAMVPKGEWSASTAYVRLDVVYYNGSSYVASQDSTGQNPSTATNYWQLLASGVDPSNYYTKNETNTKLGSKQDALVSGQNIKTVNGNSLLGAGNLELGELFVVRMTRNNSNSGYTADKSVSEIYEASYTNGKPVIAVMRDISNPVFILADCNPDGDSYVFSAIESNTVTTLRWQRTDDYTYELETMALQPHLVSGTNIKTVNNESLLGSGNVDIVGKSAYQSYVGTTTDSPVKTEAEWVASLKGEDGVSLGEVAIADNLTTDDATKVLSARQGYNLGQKVNDVDDVPTAGSEKFVKSGGVQNELALGAVYDVSAKNPTAGINNDGKFESLSALLSDANLNTLIPTAYRKGGMSIKFVQSSDNKYMQFRLMSDTFNTTVSNWQGVDDEPVVESENLVTSGGVAEAIDSVEHEINTYNEEHTSIPLTEYFGGVMRKTNLLLEPSTNVVLKVYYVPVLNGKTYRVTGNNVSLLSAVFSLLGFSTSVPAEGVSYIDILSYDDAYEAKNYTVDYVAPSNGYLLLGYQDASEVSTRLSLESITYIKTTKIGDLANLATQHKDNLVNAINDVNDKTYTGDGVFIPIKLENYIRGIIRVSSLKIEASTDERLHVYYFPVVKGNTYIVNRRNCTHISSDWAIIGFTKDAPASEGSFSVVYSTEETGSLTETITYKPTENGYLLVDYEDATEVYKRVSVIENDFSVKKAVDALIAGESSKSQDAKTALATPPDSFNIGLTRLKSKTNFLTPLVISVEGSNYNECIAKYQNIQDGRQTSQLIKVANYDLDPHIGDFSVLGQTYFRMLIGIDSEGWCYCAQRKYANLSSADPNVNIYRTQDFETFEIFKANSCGVQVTELENGELCVITIEEDDNYLKCFTYVTSSNKTIFNKKFSFTQLSQYVPAYPWSWGVSTRGSVVVIGEYGSHGQCGVVWYSRDYGNNFCQIFDLRDKAPDVPHAHIHGVCYDPYFDRVYIINGDGRPSTTPELQDKNPRIWWWDYNGEHLSDDLKSTINWKYIGVGEDLSLGAALQFVNGYALKDCILLFSDGPNNGIFRINRKTKEDTPTIDFAHHLGIEQQYTKFCGGNMFKRDENSPLLICGIREFSKDTEQSGQSAPNTYRTVKSRVFTTYDGYHFEEVWLDDTYGEYLVHFADGTSENHNIAKCGRDMCVYQLPNGHILMKYIGREVQYVYRNDVSTSGYVPFCNEVVEFVIK